TLSIRRRPRPSVFGLLDGCFPVRDEKGPISRYRGQDHPDLGSNNEKVRSPYNIYLTILFDADNTNDRDQNHDPD
ncbi:MAG: hypothetical protein Q9226_009249, partial [Calogaya cf. arnoldii]